MKSRKILYITAGVFDCIVGALSTFFALMIFLLNGVIKTMFKTSAELSSSFVDSLAESEEKYAYLKEASESEVLSFIMRIVNIVAIAFLLIGALWITFGVLNILLNSRHYSFFGSKPKLRKWFVIGCWLSMGLNVANILTTIAVYKKDKETEKTPQLYTAG